MDDRHATARERKRRKARYGPTTTNPGLRIVMRDLATKAQEATRPSPGPNQQVGRTRVKRKHRGSHQHGIGDQHNGTRE
jgi:hypothetical protein